jgi:hypothetical protein
LQHHASEQQNQTAIEHGGRVEEPRKEKHCIGNIGQQIPSLYQDLQGKPHIEGAREEYNYLRTCSQLGKEKDHINCDQ